MESLKSQSEQCIFILTTKFENSAQLQCLPDRICNYLFEKKSFPILLNNEVKSIPKKANSECTLNKIIHKIPFPIEYNKKFLEDEILSNPTLIQKARDYISLLILHFYLSFFQTYEHDIGDIVTMLKSLLLIIFNKVNKNEKYQTYAISGFITIILDKQFQIDYSDPKFLSCISDFFSLPTIPRELLQVFQFMVEKIDKNTNNDEELSNVLQIVNYSFQKYRSLFTSQFIDDIFKNLKLKFLSLNYIVLSFFSQLSEILNDQEAEFYVKAFPSALIQYYDLHEEEKKLPRTKINFDETYSSENSENIKVTLPLLFKENPPLLSLNKLELKSIKCDIFNLLMNIIKSRHKLFANIFIEQVIQTLQLHNKIKYYELLAIYIHFLIQLSPISTDFLENTRFLFEEPYFQNPKFCKDSTSNELTYCLNPYVSSIRFLIMNFLFKQEFTFIQSIFQSVLKQNLVFTEFCFRCLYVDEKFRHPELGSLLFEIYSKQIIIVSEEGRTACLITMKILNYIDDLIHAFNIICDDCTTNMNNKNLSFILDIIKYSTHAMQTNNLLIESFEPFFDKISFLLTKLPQNDPLSKLIFTHSLSLFSVRCITQNESNAIETSAISLFGLEPDLKQLIISLMGAENGAQNEFVIKQPKAILLLVRLFKDDRTIWPFLTNLCNYSPINSIYCHEAGVDSIILEQLFQCKVANDLIHEESNENKNEKIAEKDLNQNDVKKIDDLLTLFSRISKFSSSINIVNRYMSLLCNDPVNNRVSDYHMKFVKLINALALETQKIPMTAFYEFQEFSNIEMANEWTISIWIFVTDRLNCPLFSISNECLSYEISIQNQNIKLNINKSQTDHQFDCEIPLYNWVCLTFKVESQNTTLLINGKKQSSVSHQSFFINTANFAFNASHKLLIGGVTIYNTIIKDNLYEYGPRRIWKDPENSLSLAIRPHIHNNQLETVCFIYGNIRIKKEFKKAFSIMNFIDILCERCGITLILPLMVQIKMQNADSELLLETLSIIKNLLFNRSNSQKKFREMNGIRILSHLLTCCYASDKPNLDQTDLLNYKIYTKLFEIFSILEEEKSRHKFLKYILANFLIWVHCYPEDIVKIMSFLASQNKETFWKYYKLNYSLIISIFRVYFSLSDYPNVPKFKGTEKEMVQIRQNLITFARNLCDEKIVNNDFLIIISHLKYSADMSKEIDLFRFLEEIINTDFQTTKNIKPESKLMICYLMRKCIKTIIDSSKPSSNPINQSRFNYKISCDFNLLVDVIKLFYNSNYQSFSDNENQHITIEMTNNCGNRDFYKKDVVYFLMRWISDLFIDSKFLKLLIPLINENYPFLFPLGAMISVSLDEENFKNFLQQVKLNPKVIEVDDIWYLWIAIGIFEFQLERKEDDKGEEINKGIEFLLNNSPVNQLENIFLMLINLSLYKKYNETNVLSLFLRSLSKRIDNEEKCSIFIKLVMHQIYFKKYQMKLNKNQSSNNEENDNGMEFTEKVNDNNLNLLKIRSNSVLLNKQIDKKIAKFASKKSRFATPHKYSREFESKINTIDPKKNQKISMKTVDDLLDIIKRNVTDNNCIQDVKLNEKYSWLDMNLVNQIVDIFLSFPSQKSIDDVIIIEAYRLKYASQEEKIINKNIISVVELEKISKRYSISYFNKICKKINIESPFKQKIIESHLMNEYRKRKFDLSNRMKDIYDIVSEPIENTKEIFKYYTDDLAKSTHLMFKQTIHDYLASVGLIKSKSKNKWSHLCTSLMQGPETPWHSSIKHEKTHFKRDFSSCFCFCPFKLKINKKYDQHLIASFKRNTGSQKTAEELYDKFIQKLKSKEIHNTYFDLQDGELGEEESEERIKIETDISQYIFTQDCQIIQISKEIDACFMLSKDNIVIQTETKVKKYPLHSIELILLRDYLHRPTAIEIFVNNGTTILLNFPNELNYIVADEIQFQVIQDDKSLIEVQQSSNENYFKSKKITQMWCENKISNFEYLILLNIYSGRSFNNASQYPFLPWIVFDYESNRIDHSKLRDLEKPIGAINADRLNKLIKNYEEKKNEGYPPFLYSSGPTCPLAVYYWLVRVEPFTTFHIDMQSGSFDNSDRVFSSWKKTQELVTTIDDVYRELPPEAFFSHDFLVNYNEISLGIVQETNQKQENENDDPNSVENFDPSSQNVSLPPWASNPFEFIYKNRKILESEYVSENLHSWIDLVWGYKQNGQEAEKAFNVFRPEMYHDIWSSEEGKDEIFWPAIENSLSQVGQIPIQLFTDPHPKKIVQSSSKMANEISEVKLDKNDSKYIDNYNFIHISENHSYSAILNSTKVPNIKVHVDEIKNFVGAQISIKRSNSNEDQLSSNYFLLKNKIQISGLTEDGEVMNIKIGYKLNSEESNLITKRKTLKNPKFLRKNIRSKMKDDYNSFSIDKDNVTYNTVDVIKKRYNLTSDIKKKKNSSLAQKFLMKFAFLDESKICYSDNVQNVLIFDDLDRKNETELLINQNKITTFAFDGNLTVAAFDSDGFLSILQICKNGNDPETFSLECLYTIPSFYERINCCDISKNFHQVVCGSSDGFILIFSLSNQTFLRTIKLDDGKSPRFIKITNSWGFIFAVLTEISDAKKKTFLAVWTINGDFIKMKEINFEISKLTTWRSKSGFDYYLFATVEHKIIAGEVFTLENFFQSFVGDEVIELGYDYDLENAIVISKDGVISFLPCSAPPPEF